MSENRKKKFSFIHSLKASKAKPTTKNANATAADSDSQHSHSEPAPTPSGPSPDQRGSITAPQPPQPTPVAATSSGSPPLDINPEQKEPEVAQGDSTKNDSADDENERLASKAQEELKLAMIQFKETYERFANKHRLHLTDEKGIRDVIEGAEKVREIRDSARYFGKEISSVLQITQEKRKITDAKWAATVTDFLSKVYPLTRLSLKLGSIISPLKGVADGLGIILQILDDESSRSNDFYVQLTRIEYQAARVSTNPNFDEIPDPSRHMMQVKGTDLMTAIIKFFNSALLYFSKSFSGRLLKTVIEGSKIYDDGKNMLQVAINQYDQAVGDLTASIVANIQTNQRLLQSQAEDKEFMKWLSPSYWLVEAQLSAMRKQRAIGTLEWLRSLDKVREWHSRDSDASKEQTLWIRGAPGVGKSTIAGYLIDYIKCLYPESILTYFFCKSGQTGLMTARDILRTLAYQCIGSSELVRSALVKLKKSDFKMEEEVGISFLFEKLLKDPLAVVPKDIYIILDGLDEADYKTQDDVQKRPQLDILIECLAALPRSRLAIISRPPSDILKIVPIAVTKSITIYDNMEDIRIYVERFILKSDRLQRHFEKAGLNPVDYFVTRANGMFLWVDMVLQRLSTAKSKGIFEKYLNDFSQTSGNMDELYSSALTRMDPEDQLWASEVLKWLIVSQMAMTIEELQAAVQHSLEDEHDDFKDFLEVQCGSFLVFVNAPVVGGGQSVQLIHETFFSFLTDLNRCPKNFAVDIEIAHAHAALRCLTAMSKADSKDRLFTLYATIYWVNHFVGAKKNSYELLINLHQFFTSFGIEGWINCSLVRRYCSPGLHIAVEEFDLRNISNWLAEAKFPSPELSNDELYKKAFGWRESVLSNKELLGEILGKAAAKFWLYREVEPFSVIAPAFRLALKYYWKRANRSLSNAQEVEELVATNFSGIATWANCENISQIKKQNLGIAFFLLKQWEQCIKCLKPEQQKHNDYWTWMNSGLAYEANNDLLGAVKAIEKAIEKYPISNLQPLNDLFAFYSLSYVQKLLGNSQGEIDAIEKAIKLSPALQRRWDELFQVHKARGDIDSAIGMYIKAVQENPTELWPKFRLSEVYRMKGDFIRESEALKEVLEQAREKYPLDLDQSSHLFSSALPSPLEFQISLPSPLEFQISTIPYGTSLLSQLECRLAESHNANGDYAKAIDVLETAARGSSPEKSPADRQFLLDRLNNLYLAEADWHKGRGDFDKAIEAYGNVTEIYTSDLYQSYLVNFTEAYIEKGDLICAIEVLEKQGKKGWYAWESFSEWLQEKGNHDGAVKFMSDDDGLSGSSEKPRVANLVLQAPVPPPMPLPPAPFLPLSALDRVTDLWKIKGNYEELITLYERALEDDRSKLSIWDRNQIWDRLGNVYQSLDDYDEMIKVYQRALKYVEGLGDQEKYITKPSVGWPYDRLADAYKAKGELDSAIKTYESASRTSLQGQWWCNPLWDAYEAKGDANGAVKSIATLTENFGSSDGSVWYNLASGYSGHPERAIKVFELVIQKDPVVSWPWVCIGNELCKKTDYNEAATAYEMAIKKRPYYHGPHYPYVPWDTPEYAANRPEPRYPILIPGVAHISPPLPFMGTQPSARPTSPPPLSSAQPHMTKDFDLPLEVWCRLGELYEKLNNTDGAIKTYKHIIQCSPDLSWVWIKLGKLYAAKGDNTKAVDLFKHSITMRQTSSWPWICLGETLAANAEFEKAIATFEQAIEKNLTVSIVRGNVLLAINSLPASVPGKTEFVTSNYIFFKYLGDVYGLQGDYGRAVHAYQKAIELAPTDSFLYVYPYHQRFDSKDHRLDRAPYYPVSDPPIDDNLSQACLWKCLGKAHKAASNFDEATRIFDRAIATYKTAIDLRWKLKNNLAWWYGDSGFREVINQCSLSQWTLLALLGEVYKEKGDVQKAIDTFKMALDVEPSASHDRTWLMKTIEELSTTNVTSGL